MPNFSSVASEAKDNPKRDDRWCWERLKAEWPDGPSEEVKAIMWAGDRFREEVPQISESLYEISETLKEILKHMQRNA